MKFPNWLKIFWWALLIILLSIPLFSRYNAIINGDPTFFDSLILLLWFALLLAPIFQEVSFFGIKLKHKIEEVENKLSKQISEVKYEISNKIDVSPTINFRPSSDEKIQELEKRFNKLLASQEKKERPPSLEVPEERKYLFSVRYKVENEIRRIWETTFGDEEDLRYKTLTNMLRDLLKSNIVPNNLYGAIREIVAICNSGIHGEKISESQLNFVKDIGPKLIASLEDLD